MTDTVVQFEHKEDKLEIPGYQILRELGQGGMATVYLAVQQGFPREIALKVMSKSLAADDEYRQRFYREAKIVGQLSHPHIVPVHDAGYHDGHLYLAMEYLKCGDLKQRIQQNLAPAHALAISKQIAQALGFAHERGFIHRDVKPDNILFRDEDTAVLTDFGIARTQDASGEVTAVQSIIGTPRYMSPEQALGEHLDARTDIYSLGVVLYEILVGEVPFIGTNATSILIQHCSKPAPSLPEDLAMIQPLINMLLAKSKTERAQHAAEVCATIDVLQKVSVKGNRTRIQTIGVYKSNDECHAHTTEKIPSAATELWPWLLLLGMILGLIGVLSVYYPAIDNPAQRSRSNSTVPASPANGTAIDVDDPTIKEFDADFYDLNNAQDGLLSGSSSAAAGIEIATPKSGSIPVQTSAQPNSVAMSPPSPLEESDKEQQLEALYKRAKIQLSQNRLTKPHDDNALQTFNAMLAIDAGDKRAISGMETIVEQYAGLARQRERENDLERAIAMLDRGLQIDAQSKSLIEFRQQLSNELSDQQSKLEIKRLLALAEQQIKTGKYVRPAGDNAYESFKIAQSHGPTDKQITQGLHKLLQRMSGLAQEQQKLGNLQAALTLFKDALIIAPQDATLVEQKDEISELLQQSAKNLNAETNEPEKKPKKYKRAPTGNF